MSKQKSHEDRSKFIRLERAVVDEISYFLFALGNQFISVKNAEGAFDCFKYSIDLNPKHQPSVYNLGALYSLMGNLEGAYKMFKESVRMKPDDLIARTALGEIARKMGNVEESKQILQAVYKEDPESYVVMSAMAILYYDMGHLAEAMEWNERAMEKKPNDLHMLLNRALINMTYGHWPEWWSQYEYCLSYQRNEKMKNLKMSDAWAGQEMEGKTLLVVSDQGSGDAIQFSRYLPEAKRLGKFSKLIYLVQPDLKEVMARIPGIDEVLGFGENLKVDFDIFSSLLGVMRVLQVSPTNCFRFPHIITNPQLDVVWKTRVDQAWDGSSKKVGIVWAGDPKHGNDHARSLSLAQFLRFKHGTADIPSPENLQLFSFQVGPPVQQLRSLIVDESSEVVDLGSDFRNFDDTASAIKQMDLIISCDTSVPHLAGCLGKPFWVLVPNPPEWRWLTDVGTSPWYSHARVYRQADPKNWDGVIGAVLKDLHEICS